MTKLNSALFIDYDNVRTELERYDLGVAARFSNRTLVWLDALSRELGSGEERRIVSRRCYASPQRIQSYRRNFTQTGFEVIDCPPLTSHLKNSADIYIVMDVIDYLSRYPHIDEYIILSGDADFVPVLNRLRRELKRSVIFASYNTTAAYRNCSDQRIEAEFFAEHLAIRGAAAALVETTATPAASPRASAPANGALAEALGQCLRRAAARRGGRLPLATAAQFLQDELGGELGDDWAGRRSFRTLLEQVPLASMTIDWPKQEIVDNAYGSLEDWSEDARKQLQPFVASVIAATRKPIPLLEPSVYAVIFDAFAAYWRRDDTKTFADAVESVTELCAKQEVELAQADMRFIAAGISMQGFRPSERPDATNVASLWRTQVFDLCSEPDWMREPENAGRLAAWFHAPDEDVGAATEDFLNQTDDGEAPDAEAPA